MNITPDSFSESGRDYSAEAAVEHGRELAAAGAAVLDVGAEASSFFRKGVTPVEAGEQLRRLLPVVEGLGRELPVMVLSIDTRSAAVAEACLERLGGARAIINDISAGTHDGRMFEVVAKYGAGMILMHMMPGYPATAPDDTDIVGRVRAYLAERVAAAEAAGIARERLAVDPGVGFGKSMADSWRLVMGVEGWSVPGVASVLGVSRKRFLETAPPREIAERLAALVGQAPEGGGGSHPRDRMTWAVTALLGARVTLHRLHAMPERPV
ncbi:MAG TPA: dihydropteroate synthase [Phycisphaerae bacterium]|nr:dihydropteroate synthase [Phycisphaerae bacterium]